MSTLQRYSNKVYPEDRTQQRATLELSDRDLLQVKMCDTSRQPSPSMLRMDEFALKTNEEKSKKLSKEPTLEHSVTYK